MADVIITAHCFPTANDIKGAEAAGWGESTYEKNLGPNWMANVTGRNFVVSGFLLPASDPDLTMNIPSGKALIAGRYVSYGGTSSITFPASSTSHVFLKLLFDVNAQVNNVAFEHNTTGTQPADSVKIGTVTTDIDNVTSTVDQRPLGPHGIRDIFTASGTWVCPPGVTRALVWVIGSSGGGGGGSGDNSNPGSGGKGGEGATHVIAVSVTPGTSYTVTIGAGGTAGVGGGSGANGGAGGTGGTTSLGSLASQVGGAGGGGGLAAGVSGAPGVQATPAGDVPIWAGPPGGAGGAGVIGGGNNGTAGVSGRIVIFW